VSEHLDADTLKFLRIEMGDVKVNAFLASESRAAFAAHAAEAIKTGPAQTLHEHVSRVMFGNSKRLDAGVWIAQLPDKDADTIWAAQYADWCRVKKRRWPGDISAELRRFESLGMLQRVLHPDDTGRAKTYRRLPSPLWDVFIMCDVVIAEQIGERRYYQPSAGRTAAIVGELLEIRAQTSTAVEESEPGLERRRAQTAAAVEAAAKLKVRPRGKHGELRCSRCKEWKAPEHFSRRSGSSWQYKSWCKPCMATRQRQRYLTVEKEAALNMAGLTFKVSDTDDVVGLSCAGCGEIIQAGDSVHADARLVHERCMT
jgi:hypothetical protein